MQFIQRKMATDVAITEEYVIIADHLNYRYCKFCRNKIIDFLLSATYKITTQDELLMKAKSENYSTDDLVHYINKLIFFDVLEYSEFPDDINKSKIRDYKMPEGVVDSRFALEIASFKRYEFSGISRFEVFNRVRSSEVTVIGVGGVGSNLVVMLAAFGLKKITIIDNDFIEKDNLVRQIFYKETDCNVEKKVKALERFINDFTSVTEINAIEEYITDDKKTQLCLKGSKLVIQTADKPKGYIDFMVNEYCVENNIPVLFTHNNSVGPFYIPGESACYECFKHFLDKDSRGLYSQVITNLEENTNSIYPADILGAWMMAYYIMDEIVKYIIGIETPESINALLCIREGEKRKIEIERLKKCICNKKGKNANNYTP